jgi:hypothetical protein
VSILTVQILLSQDTKTLAKYITRYTLARTRYTRTLLAVLPHLHSSMHVFASSLYWGFLEGQLHAMSKVSNSIYFIPLLLCLGQSFTVPQPRNYNLVCTHHVTLKSSTQQTPLSFTGRQYQFVVKRYFAINVPQN